MENIYAIKAHIKSVESTRKITRSMKLVSASKLHRVQGQLGSFAAYAENCRHCLSKALAGVSGDAALLRENTGEEPGRVCYVAFVGNRGLCGAYNQELMEKLRQLIAADKGDYRCVICGRWGSEAASDRSLHLLRRFSEMEDVPTVEDSAALSDYLKGLFIAGEVDRVELVYQKHSNMSQRPECLRLLPLRQEEGEAPARDLIFEPDRQTLVELLCNMYVDATVRRILLESRVSEHYARMTAMTSATDNADKLVRDLSLKLNRTRQAKITTEINEVVGGSRALSDNGADAAN